MNLLSTVSNNAPAPIDVINRVDYVTCAEESSVARIITMESRAHQQCQTASRPDNMDTMLSQILGTLKSGQVSSHTDPSRSDTGSAEGSGNNA